MRSARTTSGVVHVVVLEPVAVFAEALGILLAQLPDVASVQTAADADLALRACDRAGRPAVVLANVHDAAGAQALDLLLTASEPVLVVVVGAGTSPSSAVRLAERGVIGIAPATATIEETIDLIRAVARGSTLLSPEVGAAMMRRLVELAARRSPDGGPALTAREDQVLRRLEQGMSNLEIAADLGIELRTVKNHVHNLFAKLGVRRRGEAVALARGQRLAALHT